MALVVGVVSLIAVAVAITIGYLVLVAITNNAQNAAVGLTSVQSIDQLSMTGSTTRSFILVTVLTVPVATVLTLASPFLFMSLRRQE